MYRRIPCASAPYPYPYPSNLYPWWCQRTPQSNSHYSHHSRHSRHLWQSPIHPSTQTTEPPPAARDPTVARPMWLTYVSNLCVQPTCPTYVSNLHVQPTCPTYMADLHGWPMWLTYVSILCVQLSDHIIYLIVNSILVLIYRLTLAGILILFS